jgi:hypothetical protein
MEGWYSDPYDRHEARWISQGSPTSLVRDGPVQGKDPVALRSFSANPVKLEGTPASDGNRRHRAKPSDQEAGSVPNH